MKKAFKISTALVAAISLYGLTANADARTAEEIYTSKCSVCHATGAAGAPKFGDAAAWAPRIEKGMDALFGSVAKGMNAMPPKGMCMDCTDEELKSAVNYMVSKAKKPK